MIHLSTLHGAFGRSGKAVVYVVLVGYHLTADSPAIKHVEVNFFSLESFMGITEDDFPFICSN